MISDIDVDGPDFPQGMLAATKEKIRGIVKMDFMDDGVRMQLISLAIIEDGISKLRGDFLPEKDTHKKPIQMPPIGLTWSMLKRKQPVWPLVLIGAVLAVIVALGWVCLCGHFWGQL